MLVNVSFLSDKCTLVRVLLTAFPAAAGVCALRTDMMVVVHVAAAYQVYTQPVFQLIEHRIKQRTGEPHVNIYLRTVLRLIYVVAVTVVGIVIPFFGSLMVSKCCTCRC